ncbi:MAG: hypothetical protein IT536_05105 [Hyphomicrobiales bacterium]|nr:hypothetical protein [Hyphomicrobiales bacterium]
MRTLLATAAFAVVALPGSPATAQVYYTGPWGAPALGAFAQAPLTAQQRRAIARAQLQDRRLQAQWGGPAFAAFAQAPLAQPRVLLAPVQGRSNSVLYDVYDGRRYISSDPDPFIRNDLARVQPERDD